jgi:hypothetical protein
MQRMKIEMEKPEKQKRVLEKEFSRRVANW